MLIRYLLLVEIRKLKDKQEIANVAIVDRQADEVLEEDEEINESLENLSEPITE